MIKNSIVCGGGASSFYVFYLFEKFMLLMWQNVRFICLLSSQIAQKVMSSRDFHLCFFYSVKHMSVASCKKMASGHVSLNNDPS